FGKADAHAQATFTLMSGVRHVNWYRRHGSERWKENCVFPLTTYARHAFGSILGATGDALRRAFAATRDVFFASNREWRYIPPAVGAHRLQRAVLPPAPVAQAAARAAAAEAPAGGDLGGARSGTGSRGAVPG